MVKAVQATPGAIGYVDYNYVLDNDLNAVQLRNATGHFVSAQVSGFRDAVLQSAWNRKGDFTAPLVNLPGPDTWPITMGTFIIVPAVSANGARTLDALKFLTWATSTVTSWPPAPSSCRCPSASRRSRTGNWRA